MIFKKTKETTVNDRQIDLVDYARARIGQKKRLYYHFVGFLFVSLVLVILNIGLGYGAEIQPFGYPWMLSAALLWAVFLLLHTFQVYVTGRFMNSAWEKEQIKKLVGRQEARIEKMKRKLDKEANIKANAEWQKEQPSCTSLVFNLITLIPIKDIIVFLLHLVPFSRLYRSVF